MNSLKDRISSNLTLIFFLIRNDYLLEDQTQKLIANLHDWPWLLSQLSEEADERHQNNRDLLETTLIAKREQFEIDISKLLEDQISLIPQYGDIYAYRQVLPKIQEISSKLEAYQALMLELVEEETLLFKFKSNYAILSETSETFAPYRDFWTVASEFIVNKRSWFEGMLLSDINLDEVQT